MIALVYLGLYRLKDAEVSDQFMRDNGIKITLQNVVNQQLYCGTLTLHQSLDSTFRF